MTPAERLQRAYSLVGNAASILQEANDQAPGLRLIIRAAARNQALAEGNAKTAGYLRSLADEVEANR